MLSGGIVRLCEQVPCGKITEQCHKCLTEYCAIDVCHNAEMRNKCNETKKFHALAYAGDQKSIFGFASPLIMLVSVVDI